MKKKDKKISVILLLLTCILCFIAVFACACVRQTVSGYDSSIKAETGGISVAPNVSEPNGDFVLENQDVNSGEFITVDSLFSAESGVSVKVNQNTPAYIEESRNGVSVQSKNAKKVYYKKAVNIVDNTKEDLLFELQITPSANGTMELKQFLIRFEDWSNPNNYFEISLVNYPWGQSANGIVSVKTNTISQYRSTSYNVASIRDNNNVVVDYEVTTTNTTDTQHGTVVECSFDGRNATAYHTVTNSVKFYYDNAEKAVYVANVYDWSGALTNKGYNVDGRIKVLDMDLLSDMGSTKNAIWGGFESGVVRMSVETAEMEADFANYMILTIDNQTMDGAIVNDITPPHIDVDLDKENLPYGVVGQRFNFADAVCYDEMYENETYVLKKVYFDKTEVSCTDKGFIPVHAGKYTVKYIGFDLPGNKAEEVIEIDVLDAPNPATITFDLSNQPKGAVELTEDVAARVDLFETVILPVPTVSGASGNIRTTVIVKHNNDFVTVSEGAFIPFDEGKYTVTYKVTDSVSNVYIFDYEVIAAFTGEAIINDFALDNYMLDGSMYKLPKVEYSLTDRYGQKIRNANTYIKAYNADTNNEISVFNGAEDIRFTPDKQMGEHIKFVYEVEYNGLRATKDKTVTVLTSDCLGDRFITDSGITRTIEEYALRFSTTEEGKGFAFVNRVLMEELSLRFSIPREQNNFDKLNIYINDFNEKNEKVKLTLYKNSDDTVVVTQVYANDVYLGECRGNFYETAPMDFVLSFQDTGIYDSNDDLIGRLTQTANGDLFNGFSSKFVEIRFEFEQVTGDSALSLTYVNNQMMGNFTNVNDFMAPDIYMESEMKTEYEVGDKLIIPKVFVYDFFDSLPETIVRLTDAEGNVCLEKKFLFGETEVMEYTFNEYGEYMLYITAKDAQQNEYTYLGGIAIDVLYSVKPIIHIEEEIQTTAKVNEKIELPEITVYDIKDGIIGYDIYVYAPSGTMTKVTGSFIPTSKGEYSVFVQAINSVGNIAVSETFIITVT